MTTPSLEERMARLEGSYEQIDRRLGRIETQLDQSTSDLRTAIQGVRAEVREVRSEVRVILYWQMGMVAAIAASILATVLTRLL